MAATDTDDILDAIREMEDEQRAEMAQLLAPHQTYSRRQFAGILAAVAGGSLSVQAAMAAVNKGVMPAAAADGVVSDIDTLQSGDGSAIKVGNDLDFQSAQDILNLASLTTEKGTFTDAAADPSSNGELQRNGTDLKAFSGGAVRNLSDIGGGGATTFIESQDPSGVATADFTTGIDADHNRYILELTDVVPATDQVTSFIQVSTDGGATWEAGTAYEWVRHDIESNGAEANSTSQNTSDIRISSSVGSAAGEGLSSTVKFSQPANASLVQYFHFHSVKSGAAVGITMNVGAGGYMTAAAIDGVRFGFASGNIESGTIELLGVN